MVASGGDFLVRIRNCPRRRALRAEFVTKDGPHSNGVTDEWSLWLKSGAI